MTTAKKSTHAQRKLRVINEQHAATGLFTVRLLTWDDIERIVDGCPLAQDFLGVQGPQVVRELLRNELQPVHDLMRAQAGDVRTAELDEVKKHLLDGEVPLAALLLRKMRTKSWDLMSDRQKSRWCTLLADAESRQGNQRKAADLLIQAKTHQPDDDGAVSNEIVAYELLGLRSKAFELAREAILKRPHLASVYAIAIRTAPSHQDVAVLLDTCPDHLKDHAELVLAAALRSDPEITDVEAESLARRAAELASDDARAWFALGHALIRAEFHQMDPGGIEPGDARAHSRLREAYECLSKSIELSKRDGVAAFQATALIERASASAFINDTPNAHRDIEEARRLAPNDTDVVLATARMEQERGNLGEAVHVLRPLVMREQSIQASFLLAVALWRRDSSGDRTEAIDLFARVGRDSKAHAEVANDWAVEGMVGQGRHDDARAHLDSVYSAIERCLGTTLLASIDAAEGRTEEAGKSAVAAVALVSPGTSKPTLRKLAKLLFSLGRLADSLQVWQRLLIEDAVNDDTRSLVECARRLGRERVVLDVCERARRHGIFDGFLLQCELTLLDRYDPDAALSVLEEFIRREPDNKRARLHLVNLALRLGRNDLASNHFAMLPGVMEAEVDEGAAVVAALAHMGRRGEAIEYGYDLLRRWFADHRAHRAFRDAIMFRDVETDVDATKSGVSPREGENERGIPGDVSEQANDAGAADVTVAPGVAVRLVEPGVPTEQWFVLEDSKVQASGVDCEIRADSALALKLSGKKIGDEVALSEGPGLTRVATVAEILPKHVFRFRDVLNQWQYRFPDHQEMWMVRVARADDENKADFSALFAMAKDQHRRQKDAEALYRDQMIPVHLFGTMLGKTEIQAMGLLAGSDGTVLRCCAGTADEYAEAAGALASAAEIVIDLTALATLMMLDEVAVLESLGKTVVVTPSTIAGVREFLNDARSHANSMGSMGATEEGPVLFTKGPEEERAFLETIERHERTLNERCKVVPCAALADVDDEERKVMERGLGRSSMESAVVGAAGSRVLWTDDGYVARLAREKFGAKRVWTQAVLRWLNGQGLLSNERYARASARLVGWQYMFTTVNPEVLRHAGNDAEWQPARFPLKQVLTYLSLPDVRAEDAAFLSAMLIAHCYLDAVLPETRRGLLQGAAEALAARADGERTVPLFGSILSRVFGLSMANQRDAMQTFIAWRREQLRRVAKGR
ncbi:MAG TPA: tetratricopeptide repeat protein [Polyangiaceae bacterium]|nr:tetratricopeptide repeat protein [Polyangiaceae bacterium]